MLPARVDCQERVHARRLRSKAAILAVALALILAACATCEPSSDPGVPSTPAGPGDPVAGASTYRAVCSSCHGADLQGVDDLGTALLPSAFIAERTEAEIVEYTRVGREADDPENETGVLMPPSGGAPWLSDQDLANVATYLKGLQ